MNVNFKKLLSLVFLCLFSLCAPTLFALDTDDQPEAFNSAEEAIARIRSLKQKEDRANYRLEDTSAAPTEPAEYVALPPDAKSGRTNFTVVKVGATRTQATQVYKSDAPEHNGALYILNPTTGASEWFDESKGHVHVTKTADLADEGAVAARLKQAAPFALPATAGSVVSTSTVPSTEGDDEEEQIAPSMRNLRLTSPSASDDDGSPAAREVAAKRPGVSGGLFDKLEVARRPKSNFFFTAAFGESSPRDDEMGTPVPGRRVPTRAKAKSVPSKDDGVGDDERDTPRSPVVSVRTKPLSSEEQQAQAVLNNELAKLRAASEKQVADETRGEVKPLGTKVRRALQAIYEHADTKKGSLKKKIKALQDAVSNLSVETLADADVQRSLETLDVNVRAVARVTENEDLLATPLRTHGLLTQLERKITDLDAKITAQENLAMTQTRKAWFKSDNKKRTEAGIAALQAERDAFLEFYQKADTGRATQQEMADALSAVLMVTEAADEETRKLTTELFRAKRAEAYATAAKKGTTAEAIPFPTTAEGEAERQRIIKEARRAVDEKFKAAASSEDNIKYAKTLLARQTAALRAFERFQAAQAGIEASGAKKTEDIDARLEELRRTEAVLQASFLELNKKIATATIEEQRAQQLLMDHLRLRNADLQKRIKDLEDYKTEQDPDLRARRKAAEKLAKFEYAVEASPAAAAAAAVVASPRPKSTSGRVVPADVVASPAPNDAKGRAVTRVTRDESAESGDSRLLRPVDSLDLNRAKAQRPKDTVAAEGRGRSRQSDRRAEPVAVAITLQKRGSDSRASGRSELTRYSQVTADSTDASSRSRASQQKPSSRPSTGNLNRDRSFVPTSRSKVTAQQQARAARARLNAARQRP